MLTVRPLNRYQLDKGYTNVEYTNTTFQMNNVSGYKSTYFELNDSVAEIRFDGIISGETYFIDIEMDITQIDNPYGELLLRLEPDTTAHYITVDTKKLSIKYVSSDTYFTVKIYSLNSIGYTGDSKGFINSVSFHRNLWNEIDVDLNQIKITNSIKQTQDLTKVNTLFSKDFDIYLNEQNANALDIHQDYAHNFNNNVYSYDMRFSLSDVIIVGKLRVLKLTKDKVAKVNIYSNLSDFIEKISTNKLNKIKGLSTIQYNLNNIITKQYKETEDLSDKEYCWILHDWGQDIKEKFINNTYNDKCVNKQEFIDNLDFLESDANSYLNKKETDVRLTTASKYLHPNVFTPALFAKNIFKKIHSNSGFVAKGDFLNTDDFQKLLILPSNFEKNLDDDTYAFSITTPTTNQKIILSENSQSTTHLYGVDDSNNHTLTASTAYPSGEVDTIITKTGMYSDIDYEIEIEVYQSNGTGTYDMNYNLDIRLQYDNMTSGNDAKLLSIVEQGAFAYSGTAKTFTYQGTLEDVYMPYAYGFRDISMMITAANYDNGSGREITYKITKFNLTNKGKIKSKNIPTRNIELKTILPDITEQEFIKTIISMYNLYPIIEYNTITYYTYDEFYKLGEVMELVIDEPELEYELQSEYISNSYKFTQTSDDRGEIAQYNKTNNLNYGDYQVKTQYLQSETEFSIPFGIPYKQDITKTGSSTHWIFGRNSEHKLSQTRHLWCGKDADNYYNNWEISNFLILGHWKSLNYPSIVMIDEFLREDPTYGLSYLNTATPDNLDFEYLYNNYYSDMISNLIHPSGIKMVIKTQLDEREFANLDLFNIIRIKNGYYIIEKISDWNPNSMTTITLIKWTKNVFY